MMDPLARIEQLRREIRHHEECYYIRHAPEISDQQFDRLLAEAREDAGVQRFSHCRSLLCVDRLW